MATQCVRCGRVLNLEERRCPRCLASLSNQQIGTGELTRHQLNEIASVERANMTTRYARRGLITGLILGGLGMLIAMHPVLIIGGVVVGGTVGWFVAWRRWGQIRTSGIFAAAMLPIVWSVTPSPFIVLSTICTGMVIGVAVQLNREA
jgi:hypothetical protein